MADGIRLLVTLDDKGSPKINKIKASMKGLGDETKRQGDRWNKAWGGMKSGVNQTTDAVKKLGPAVAIGAAALGAMFGAGVKSGIAFNAKLETIKTQYRVIIGDAAKANKLFQETLDFSARTPFQMADVAVARKMLIAFGQDSLEALTITGDAAAAAGIKIDEMAMVMGRISAGAFGEAFMRLAETGLATRQMLEGEGLVFDRGGAYQGSADEAMAAVQAIIKRRFGGMMDEQSRTFEGSVSTMIDNWNILVGKVTKPLFDKLKPEILEITALFQKWMEAPELDRISTKIADLFTELKSGGATVINIGKGIWEFKEGITAAAVSLGALTAAQSVYNLIVLANPWAIAIVAVAALIGALTHLEAKSGAVSKAWRGFGLVMESVANLMRAGFQSMVESMAHVIRVAFTFGESFGLILKGIAAIAPDAFGVIKDVATSTVDDILDVFSELGTGIQAALRFDFSAVKDSMDKVAEITQNGFADSIAKIKTIGVGAFSEAGTKWGEAAGLAGSGALEEIWSSNMNRFWAKQGAMMKAITQRGTGDTQGPTEAPGASPVGEDPNAAFLQDAQDGYAAYIQTFTDLSDAESAHQQQIADSYKEMWGEAYMDVASMQQTAYGLIEENTAALFESIFDSSMNGGQKWQAFWDSLSASFIKASTQMAARWAFDQIRMALVKQTVEVKMTASAIAGASARASAALAETAIVTVEQRADQAAAVTKIFKAHAGIPFAGVAIAGAQVTAMMAAITATRALRTGGLLQGSGSGVEDNIPLGGGNMGSPNEFLQPTTSVNHYGLDFMEAVRNRTFEPSGGSTTVQINVGGGGNADMLEVIEDEVVPILERLSGQGRFTLAVS